MAEKVNAMDDMSKVCRSYVQVRILLSFWLLLSSIVAREAVA